MVNTSADTAALQAENESLRQRLADMEQRLHGQSAHIALWQALADALPHPVVLGNAAGLIHYCNEAARAWLPPDRVSAYGMAGLAVDEDQSQLQALMQQAALYGRAQGTVRCVCADGQLMSAEILVVAQHQTADAVPDLLLIARDIWPCRQTEEALHVSVQRFRAIFEHADIGISVATVHGQILETNPALQSLLGYTEAELRTISYAELTHPDDRPRERAYYQEMLADGRSTYQIEKRCIRKDGTPIWCRLTVSLLSLTDESPTLGIAMIENISHYKQVVEELQTAYTELQDLTQRVQRSRDLLRTIFDGLPDGLLLLDDEGHILIINQALASLFGAIPDHLVGRQWQYLCRQNSPPFPGSLALHTLRDGRARHRRERLHAHDGQLRILDLQTLPLMNADKSVDLVIMHSSDVTEHLQMEALIMQNEKFASSGRLAATIAHEVNSPLQSIQNLLFLASTDTEAQRASTLSLIGEEIERISTILGQLLSLYRPDATTPAPLDVNSLVERVLLLSGGTLARQHIHLERELDPMLPPFVGPADQITQVLINLIVNAVDAMPQGGTLRLRTRSRSPEPHDTCQAVQLVIEVSDTGVGMPPAIQAQVFTPFFTTKADGTGLGLAISQQIIAQYGGYITVCSSPDQGSTFTVVLPLATRTPEEEL